jgi:hypothetical protein
VNYCDLTGPLPQENVDPENWAAAVRRAPDYGSAMKYAFGATVIPIVGVIGAGRRGVTDLT